MSKSLTNVQELGGLANLLARDYNSLANDCHGAIHTSTNPQVMTVLFYNASH